MQDELDLIWEHLLPAMKAEALPSDPAAEARLQQMLAALALPPPVGQATSHWAEKVSGKAFAIEKNDAGFESASFGFKDGECMFTLKDGNAKYRIGCGMEKWRFGETALPGTPPRIIAGGAPKPGTPAKVAASGRWKSATPAGEAPLDVYEMTWRYFETPHHDTVTCQFEGDTVKIAFLSSVAEKSGKADARQSLMGKLL